MATTYKQLLNRVLRTLGEDEIAASVATLSEQYHKVLAEFVNTIKEEVEDAHQWRALRQKHTATVLADAESGTITSATERSRVIRIQESTNHRLIPLVYDTTNSSDPQPLQEMDLAKLLHLNEIDPDLRASAEPVAFAVDNVAEDSAAVYVYPRPSSNRTITLYMTTPQARLGDSDLTENIDVPVKPIEIGVLWYALEERGEELGPNSLFSEERYKMALDAAIAKDDAEQGNAVELVLV